VKGSSSSSKANVNPDVGKGLDDGNYVVNPDGEGLDGVESLEKLVNEKKKKKKESLEKIDGLYKKYVLPTESFGIEFRHEMKEVLAKLNLPQDHPSRQQLQTKISEKHWELSAEAFGQFQVEDDELFHNELIHEFESMWKREEFVSSCFYEHYLFHFLFIF